MPGLQWSLVAALLAAGHAAATPSVRVDMNAAFPAPTYLLELLETAAGENDTAYFPLLDRVASGYFLAAASEAELYSTFVDVLREDGHISTPEALSTFNLALSLRSAAPRIEAHFQYYATAVEPGISDVQRPECDDWVLLDGKQYCTASLDTPIHRDSLPDPVRSLPFDRVDGSGKEAVLYGDPTSSCFGSFHRALRGAAKDGRLSYRLRYRLNQGTPKQALPVNGYGVELALKRTDYIVIDDREASQDSPQKTLKPNVDLDVEEDQIADLKPLSTSELESLGMRSASFILQSVNPFEALVKLTADFPKFSASIAAHGVSSEFVAEHNRNCEEKIPEGFNVLWMNGVRLIDRQIDPFALVDMIRRERKLVNGVRELGFTGRQAVSLLGHEAITSSKIALGPTRYDWTDRREDGNTIVWFNDLEDAQRYPGFPKKVTALLQRGMPGQLPQVGKNLFHLVVPADLSNQNDLDVVTQLIDFMDRGVPLRFGLVPLTSTRDGSSQAKLVYYLHETCGEKAVLEYLQKCRRARRTTPDRELFTEIVRSSEFIDDEKDVMTLDQVLDSERYSNRVKLAQKWATRLGADTKERCVFANGMFVPRDTDWMQTMSMKLGHDLRALQEGVFSGMIDDDTSIVDMLLEDALVKRNMYVVLEDNESPKIVDVRKMYSDHAGLLSSVPSLKAHSESAKESWAVVAAVVNLGSDEGKNLLLAALSFKRNNPGVQLDIIHNPQTVSGASRVNAALRSGESELADMENGDELEGVLGTASASEDPKHDMALSGFLTAAGLSPGSQALILNGRVIGPFTPDAPFTDDDMQQLLDYELRQRILPVYSAMEDMGLGEKLSDPVAAAKVTSITALSAISDLPEGIFDSNTPPRTSIYDTLESNYSAVESGDPDAASIHIAGLLNPASEQGQRWSPILKIMSELDGVYVKIFLNPRRRITELPVKSFYRLVLDSKPRFDDAGNVKSRAAIFKGLPSEALLTVGMVVPPAWFVSPKVSVHDLDNIKLSSIQANVEATYELEHILIEGHSRQTSGAGSPRGAQLVLSTESDVVMTDTIIMANMGFFQFQANPGLYSIRLKEGRSADIYEIESIGARGWAPVPGDEGTDVSVMDFQGTTLYPRLRRKAGMGSAEVLDVADDTKEGILEKGFKLAESFFGGGSGRHHSVDSTQEQAEINIFSVASGHLYERMLNIMMVSVMRHTKHTVKFWFIEQFLSPSFKDFIPHMAAEYGFRYEMVAYKWPHWLRQQKEKQRQIWGYKILFLDVLFPLDLDKVIFVDADQIVRTDMMDLVNHDLEGAPYGFTPMCDSRVEMEGFRFWKQGYWANLLRDRPYHISALYVVDLRRFRQLAAGDRLRQQYHALSADPNSLSNLDQDLPNNMQFQIPIHSLPQEWLWCETWCSDEALATARTIDLCNNPLTKEPKLDRARRQVPEWTAYDEEIAALDRRRRGKAAGKKEEEEAVNTMSRRFEEEPVHTKDEL